MQSSVACAACQQDESFGSLVPSSYYHIIWTKHIKGSSCKGLRSFLRNSEVWQWGNWLLSSNAMKSLTKNTVIDESLDNSLSSRNPVTIPEV